MPLGGIDVEDRPIGIVRIGAQPGGPTAVDGQTGKGQSKKIAVEVGVFEGGGLGGGHWL